MSGINSARNHELFDKGGTGLVCEGLRLRRKQANRNRLQVLYFNLNPVTSIFNLCKTNELKVSHGEQSKIWYNEK